MCTLSLENDICPIMSHLLDTNSELFLKVLSTTFHLAILRFLDELIIPAPIVWGLYPAEGTLSDRYHLLNLINVHKLKLIKLLDVNPETWTLFILEIWEVIHFWKSCFSSAPPYIILSIQSSYVYVVVCVYMCTTLI